MKTLIKILLLTSVFLLVIFSCKKDQLEIKKTADPCDCASEVSADFVIEEQLYNVPHYDWVETDTILHDSDVQFRALVENADYKWYIGSEQFQSKSISRFFSDQWIGCDIPITLVVKKEPNTTCFPSDDGYDSITKKFHVSKYMIEYGDNQDMEYGTIEGTYRMFSKELNDSIDISVDVVNVNAFFTVNITNINGSGVICGNDVVRLLGGRSFREIEFDHSYYDSSICPGLSGVIRNKINGEAEMLITSRMWEGSSANLFKTKYHYLGRKLNN